MKNVILYKLNSGKNSKLVYYFINIIRIITPKFFFQRRLKSQLESLNKREDKEYIERRVNYYNKLSTVVKLPDTACRLSEQKMSRHKVYYFDSYEYTRWFPGSYQWGFCPGDITYIADYPSISKSRPLTDNNENMILMKLNKVRHFIFVNDKKAFVDKKNMAVFRGKVCGKPLRERFMEMYFNNPMCDLGETNKRATNHLEWKTGMKTIREHLDYKFVLALEGNDVASNLKWIMSSNSIAVMPRPSFETWFMEGTLIPNYHYIEIKADFSDLESRLNYYIDHIDEAQQIIRNANEFVSQFKNKEREDLISLLVLNKYFVMTGQKQLS